MPLCVSASLREIFTPWELQHELTELCDSLQRSRDSITPLRRDPDSVVGVVSTPTDPLTRYLARAAVRDQAKVCESNRRAHLRAQHPSHLCHSSESWNPGGSHA